MLFVQLGAPGIDVLRSPAEVRRKVLDQAGAGEDRLWNCYTWNYEFTQATGVLGPDVDSACSGGNDPGRAVSFKQWFQWLELQR